MEFRRVLFRSPRRSLPGASTSMSPRNCWTQTRADGVAMTGKLDSPASEAAAPSSARRTVTVSNQKGLHARAAAQFVKLAEHFDAQVTVENSDPRVPGCPILGTMMLDRTNVLRGKGLYD